MDISLDALPQHAFFSREVWPSSWPIPFLLLGVLVRLFWSTLHYMDEC